MVGQGHRTLTAGLGVGTAHEGLVGGCQALGASATQYPEPPNLALHERPEPMVQLVKLQELAQRFKYFYLFI